MRASIRVDRVMRRRSVLNQSVHENYKTRFEGDKIGRDFALSTKSLHHDWCTILRLTPPPTHNNLFLAYIHARSRCIYTNLQLLIVQYGAPAAAVGGSERSVVRTTPQSAAMNNLRRVTGHPNNHYLLTGFSSDSGRYEHPYFGLL